MSWLIYRYEEPIRIKFGTWFNVGEIEVNYGIILDSLSMIVMVPVGIVTLCVLIYAIDYMRHDPNRNRFYIILSVFAIFMTILVVSENYLMMFIGWEFVGVVSYLLISFWNTRITAMKSGLSAILLNRMGDTFFVICLGILFNVFHAVDFETVELLTPHINTYILNIIALLLLLAATAKSAQLGLHGWLLSAMEGLVKRALFKFHYMREHPNTIWSSLFFKSSVKSKLSLIYFFSLLKYGQHSGNQKILNNILVGSSETLRETFYFYLFFFFYSSLLFSFSIYNYNNNYYNYYNPSIIKHPYFIKNNPYQSKDFIYWLIGFTEGDGSFIINTNKNRNNKNLEFKITQSSNDAQILFYIKKNLGIGSVSVQDKNNNTHQFRIRDKNGILKIINIFNGNIYLNKTQNKFKEFVEIYNETYKTNIKILENKNEPTLENAWLAGFTDAEGCFTISFIKNKYFLIRYILSQKYEDNFMNKLALLLDGNTYILKCGTTNMVVNYLNLIKIIKYLNKYGLKTKKLIIFRNWLDVYYRIKNKEHKDPNKLDIILKKVNKKYKIK